MDFGVFLALFQQTAQMNNETNENAKNRISSHGQLRLALQAQTKNCIKSKLLSHPGHGGLKWLK